MIFEPESWDLFTWEQFLNTFTKERWHIDIIEGEGVQIKRIKDGEGVIIRNKLTNLEALGFIRRQLRVTVSTNPWH